MQDTLDLGLPDPEWVALLKEQRAKGRSVSDLARESEIPRSSLSMLLRDCYPADSLDLASAKHSARVVRLYRGQVLCPHLGRGIGATECETFASVPMSTSNPEKLKHWRACRQCALNPKGPH